MAAGSFSERAGVHLKLRLESACRISISVVTRSGRWNHQRAPVGPIASFSHTGLHFDGRHIDRIHLRFYARRTCETLANPYPGEQTQ